MFRSIALFCCAAVVAFSAAFAQNAEPAKPDVVKATPEILAMFEESFRSLDKIEPAFQAGILFQLFDSAMRLDDKAPAKKALTALTVLVPTIEPEDQRKQLYENLAHAHCALEQYTEAAAVLQQMKPADRYKSQIDLAVRMVFDHEEDKNKTLKLFDASELLRQAASGAVEAKDKTTEVFARIFLGRELARQGKKEESAAAFAEATRLIKGLTEPQDQVQGTMLLIQSQVLYDQIEGAQTASQMLDTPEFKQAITNTFVQTLIQHEKCVEAENLIKTFPADQQRDQILLAFVMANIKTITDEKVGELSALVSSDEHRERFFQAVTAQLQKNNRGGVAVQVSKRAKEQAGTEVALFVGKVQSLVEAKKFAEAVKFIEESKEEDSIRQHLKRQVLAMQFNDSFDDAVAQKIAEIYTTEEKISVAELRETAKQAAKNPDAATRMDTLIGVVQEQFQIVDIAGAKQTLVLFTEQIGKETDPAKSIEYRLILARFQVALRDKAGAKETLGKLMQMLAAVKDLKELKSLVSAQQPAAAQSTVTEGGKLKLDLPGAGGGSAVDESAIRDVLFQVYLSIADQFAEIEASAETKAAVEKAKALARLEPVAQRRAEKLLALSQFLTENTP